MKYSELAKLYQSLSSTTKRLEKTYLISEFLKIADVEDLPAIVLMLQGRIFPVWSDKKIGVAGQLVLKAISIATGKTIAEIEQHWKEIGDIGEVAALMVKGKSQATLFSTPLSISKVFSNLRKLPEIEGQGSVDRKIKIVAELLTSASPLEATFIVRAVIEDLRVGVGDGTLRDALCWAYVLDEVPYDPKSNSLILSDEDRKEYNTLIESVQHGYDLTTDFAQVAARLKEKGLAGLSDLALVVGRPVKIMLYQKAQGITDAFERVGRPCQFEYKYDGFLTIIHKSGDIVWIYTRRQEDVTKQFPEVVDAIRTGVKADTCILNAEVVGYDPDTKKFRPFQEISQRIRRKYEISILAKKLPCEVYVFDMIYCEGETLLDQPYSHRRDLIKKHIASVDHRIKPAHGILTDSDEEAQRFYEEALANGLEGVMAKKLDAIYKPGSRVGYGVKVKPVMDTLDLVIIGAEWGEGKRAGWLTSFVLGCLDETGEVVEIGRFGTGLKEKPEEGFSFMEMTELLRPLIIEEEGKMVRVKPEVVISVHCEEIQKSPSYTSGYALRFPRFAGLREDKPVEEIATIDQIEEMYFSQRGRGA